MKPAQLYSSPSTQHITMALQKVQDFVSKVHEQSTEVAVVIQDRVNTQIFKFNPDSRRCVLRPIVDRFKDLGEISLLDGCSVGHLLMEFVIYDADGDAHNVRAEGTAFVVAKQEPDLLILQTAAHNVRLVDGVPISSWDICFDWSRTSIDTERERFYSCSLIEQGPLDGSDVDPVSAHPLDHQHDVAFLQTHVSPDTFAKVVVLAPALPQDGDIGIVGWPSLNHPSEAFPQATRPGGEKYAKQVDANWLHSYFFGVQYLTLTVGTAKNNPAGTIGTHTASTLRGYSGSPEISLLNRGIYHGMHISGAPRSKDLTFEQINHNVVLTTLHPTFVTLYRKHVLPALNRSDLAVDAKAAFDKWNAATAPH